MAFLTCSDNVAAAGFRIWIGRREDIMGTVAIGALGRVRGPEVQDFSMESGKVSFLDFGMALTALIADVPAKTSLVYSLNRVRLMAR